MMFFHSVHQFSLLICSQPTWQVKPSPMSDGCRRALRFKRLTSTLGILPYSSKKDRAAATTSCGISHRHQNDRTKRWWWAKEELGKIFRALSHRLQAVVKSMNVDRQQAAEMKRRGKIKAVPVTEWMSQRQTQRDKSRANLSHFTFSFHPIALSSMLNIDNLKKVFEVCWGFAFLFFIWILKVSESSSSSSLWSTFECLLQIASSRFNLVSLVVALLLHFVDVIKPCEVLWPCTHNFSGWRVGDEADEHQIQTTYLLYKTISGRQIVSLGTWSISTPLY